MDEIYYNLLYNNSEKVIDFKKKWFSLNKIETKIMVAVEILAQDERAYRGTLKSFQDYLGIKTPNTIKKAIETLKEQGLLNYIIDKRIYTISITEKARKDKTYFKIAKEWIDTLKSFNKDENNKTINKSLSVDWTLSLKLLMILLKGDVEQYQKQKKAETIIVYENNKEVKKVLEKAVTQKEIADMLGTSKTQLHNCFKAIETVDLGNISIDSKYIIYKNGDYFYYNLGKQYNININFI